MNLLKSKLSVAITIGILGGSTQAFACVVTPDSILTEGQTLQLVADCTGADGTAKVQTIDWQMAVGTDPKPVSITGVVTLAQPKPKKIYLTTPIGLTSAGTGEYTFSVTGTYVGGGVDGADAPITTGESAKVIVKPASVAVALALGTNSVTAVNASCGTADGGVVASMPTGTAQCTSGKGALAISGPSYFTWTCLSQTGGAEDNCYATRTGYVAPTTTTPTTTTPTTTTPTTTTPTTTTPTTTTSTSSSDPGIGAGLWVPPNMPNRTVADQTGTDGLKISYVPGCLNGLTAVNAASGCSAMSSYAGTIAGTTTSRTVSMGSGNQLVLRYKSTPTAGSSVRYIQALGADGSNVGVNMRVWLSTNPSATYATVDAKCKMTTAIRPTVVTGPGYCAISPNTTYYFGIEFDEALAIRLQINELGADFL